MATVTSQQEQILVAGTWQPSQAEGEFQASNPANCEVLSPKFPVSSWQDCETALNAATVATNQLRATPPSKIADFLDLYADKLDANLDSLAQTANAETALPIEPRLAKVEGPRTSNQLRLAAKATREGTWAHATIDSGANIRSLLEPIGPVCVFGPNNFPFAFNSVAGGDFAAAIAAGNPVIGKANTSHPATTQQLAQLARAAVEEAGLPAATVQLLYRLSHSDGARLAADNRVGAIGYTGSRSAGLKLKAAADAVGTPIYLELSSVNPVVILPGAFNERSEAIVDEFLTSVLMGTGQFCTNPGLVLMLADAASEDFIAQVQERFASQSPGTLLSSGVQGSLANAIQTLQKAGAQLLCGGEEQSGTCAVSNTLLRATASQFLRDPAVFQTEAFGNASLLVTAESVDELKRVAAELEGNLTGCIYTATSGADDQAYAELAPVLSQKVGRLLNDKMPTGVAVSPAMNHGGPFPATGHPGFTAVGIPASLIRFAKLTCYDNVRPDRLPPLLQDKNPTGACRFLDGTWTNSDVQ